MRWQINEQNGSATITLPDQTTVPVSAADAHRFACDCMQSFPKLDEIQAEKEARKDQDALPRARSA